MSSYYILINKDNTITPVHNMKTGLFFVRQGQAEKLIDRYSGRVLAQK